MRCAGGKVKFTEFHIISTIIVILNNIFLFIIWLLLVIKFSMDK